MTVNPEILKWARDTAGLTVADAARKLGFADTRQRSAQERLSALETGARRAFAKRVAQNVEGV